MKKIYLLLSFMIISLGMVKSTPNSKIIINPYVQTQITKSIFEIKDYNRDWIKLDSSKIVFDFIDNNKIIVNRESDKNVYDVRIKRIDRYDNCQRYIMKGIDSYKQKYNIDVMYYYDNSVLLIIQNDSSIVRYKFVNFS